MAPVSHLQQPRAGAAAATDDADGMAVASFVLGLIGLLLFNVVLGPCALVLATLALVRGTNRRARAALGLALGTADLLILAAAIATSHGTIWQLGA
ncbi:threonine/homoserine/homoserine lactone efflux protein [Kitasatospora sp. MAP12-15]|uniref:DUF4190 domain-containing protein n=1 Tax=unclassified Kitasatospora TaxID=2633591 RepID=UPI002475BFD3|nr:DUF4190 domain-containing protein [Kitasatospora sp. MAP12-44]MDH6114927.1 threonine/homoserine/homoserine lactone efflux protein [Kitasatospora sp. MAP12-44]